MKKNKNFSSVCYAVAALMFCICAAMEYFSGNSSMGTIHLCLGGTFLCLMASEINKNKDNDNNDNNGGKSAEEDKKDEENK